MTQPVQEPTPGRTDRGLEWKTSQLFRRPASTSNVVVYAIKVTGDNDGINEPAQPFLGHFYWGIPSELDGWYVVKFWGYQQFAGSNGVDTEINLVRTVETGVPIDWITSTPVTIPDNGYFPSVQAVIDDTVNQVTAESTILRIDIPAVDGAYGIGVEATLSPSNVLL